MKFKSVDQYISSFPKDTQKVLEALRKIIKTQIPNGEEVISYNIPCYKVNGKYIVYFAGFKGHVSIHPLPKEVEDQFSEISSYKTSGKGTIQFPLDKPLPTALIKKITKAMLKRRLERT